MPENKTSSAERYAKSDIEDALGEEKKYRHEFSDFFSDPDTVKRKARTLSILRAMSEGEKGSDYFEAVFKVLTNLNVPCELPLSDFESFYKKYKWYFRTGPVPALLNGNFNPNV